MKHTRLQQSTGAHSPLTRAAKVAPLAFLAAIATLTTPAFAAVAPPSTPDLLASCDSGVSNSDNITNVTQPTFTGTGTPFATITLRAGDGPNGYGIGYAIVPPSGKWSIAPNQKFSGDGARVLSARQTVGGVQSLPSPLLTLYIDTTAPHLPSAPNIIARHDHGSSNHDNITNLQTPTFQGTFGTNGDDLYLYNTTLSSTVPIGHAQIPANSTGNWSCPVSSAFPAGTHDYLVRAQVRDLAGNVSALSDPTSITIDTDRPGAAEMPDLIAADDSGASHTDNITNVTQPTFAIMGDPFARVELYAAGISPTLLGSAVTNQYGDALVKTSQPLVGNQIYALNYDTAGNASLHTSPTLVVTVDTTPPIVSTPSLLASSDGGIQGDNLTNDNTPTFGGICDELSSSIEIYAAQGENGMEFAGKLDSFTGFWKATPGVLKDGTYEIGALATDLAGNVGKSATFKLTIDTTGPAQPSMPDLLAADDTGISNSDNITSKTTLNFSGLAPASSKITLYNGASLLANTQTNAQGQWKTVVSFSNDQPLSITATAFDDAGNASAASLPLKGLLDTTQANFTLTTISNSVAKNFNTVAGNVADPKENGVASGLVSLSLSIERLSDHTFWSGSQWASVNATLPTNIVGIQWSKTTDLPLLGSDTSTQLQDGDYKLALCALDKAGNLSTGSAVISVDDTAPTVTILTPGQSATLTASVLNVTGTASDNRGIIQVKVSLQRKRNNTTYYWDGSGFGTTPTSVDATVTTAGDKKVTWSCSSQLPHGSDLASGTYMLSAAAYDATGNMRVSSARTFTIQSPTDSTALNFANSAGSS